jgi:hypothetical protein
MKVTKPYQAKSNKKLFFWVEQYDESFVVIQQVTGYPSTEACDDWFIDLEDAEQMAKEIAELS